MKVIDQLYPCQIPGQVFGLWSLQCRLRIFQPHSELQLVIITDMGLEMGWFIPYIVERLIEKVVQEFELDPAKLIWIEHYTPEFRRPTCAACNQVVFDWYDGQAHNPQWVPIAPAALQVFIQDELSPVAA